ncbi:MAG TPA: bifunctional DNA-formamidopyrimidine glycosylase/DNA-(apurinic or apyrimidinic site) lyase [Acidimicrobiia bacterium]|nr:bifunctional DNA-formamidopyrimidine glycosylase/DNA-(apurinic or apyrimidinic site) lyase [Acidimicrobiia bacterium]
MPELPEVEVIRRDLERDVVGRKIKKVEAKEMRAIRRHPNKKHFVGALEGRKIKSLERRGKYLLFTLDDGQTLVVHLGMSGQLLRATQSRAAVAKHTHVIITFTQGGQLRFRDPRTFGEMFVVEEGALGDVPEISELGVDPLEQPLSWDDFGRMLLDRKVKLKALLMDQKFMAGLGNIYSDEVLFGAGLSHDRKSDTLSTQEVRRLYRALVETIQEAVKYRWTTLDDNGYVDLSGEPGEFQDHLRVYGHEGDPCRRCRRPIVRRKVGGRSNYFCEACQV